MTQLAVVGECNWFLDLEGSLLCNWTGTASVRVDVRCTKIPIYLIWGSCRHIFFGVRVTRNLGCVRNHVSAWPGIVRRGLQIDQCALLWGGLGLCNLFCLFV